MKVLILGATGRTGKLLVEEALSSGLEVNAIVRKASKLAPQNGLTVLEGDVTDEATLTRGIEGCEAVLSCLNISRTSDFPWAKLRTPEHFLEDMLKALINVMGEKGVRRLILTSAWGVADSRGEIPGWFRWFIDNSNVGKAYVQHEVQENLLAKSDLDWTAIRPVGLNNRKRLKELIISLEGTPQPSLMISRKHTANFMVDIITDSKYFKKTPVISEK